MFCERVFADRSVQQTVVNGGKLFGVLHAGDFFGSKGYQTVWYVFVECDFSSCLKRGL